MTEYHDSEYIYLVNEILKKGKRKSNRTGVDTIGILGAQMRFDLTDRFPLLTTKKLPLRWIFEELRWFLSGSTDVRDLQAQGVDIWDEWATEEHNGPHGRAWYDMGPIYGKQFRSYGNWDITRVQHVQLKKPSLHSCQRADYYVSGDGSYEIIENMGIKNGRSLVRIKFSSGFETIVRKDFAERGSCKDPYTPSVHSIGYVGEPDKTHPLYKKLKRTWAHMLSRCYNPACKEYPSYGGKGVTVSLRWHSFAAFMEDSLKLPGVHYLKNSPNSTELDKDHFSGSVYSPETCIWMPSYINKRYIRWKAFKAVSPEGQQYLHGSAGTFAELHNLSRRAITKCLNNKIKTHKGWTFEYVNDTIRYTSPVDQIANLEKAFKERSQSRRLILNGWNPAEQDKVALPPCHTLTQWSVDDDLLHCHLYQRSADVFLGVPFNIASYALLVHMFAYISGLKPGSLIHTIHDAHLYENHLEVAEKQTWREAPRSPTLVLAPKEPRAHVWDFIWEDVKLDGYNPLGKLTAEVAV